MQRQRVPSLDTTNPVGWFARFIAIASTLGCGLAFSAEDIPNMDTNTVYDKIEAEAPVAPSSSMADTQRARKKRHDVLGIVTASEYGGRCAHAYDS